MLKVSYKEINVCIKIDTFVDNEAKQKRHLSSLGFIKILEYWEPKHLFLDFCHCYCDGYK